METASMENKGGPGIGAIAILAVGLLLWSQKKPKDYSKEATGVMEKYSY